jgi:hypothetical protein
VNEGEKKSGRSDRYEGEEEKEKPKQGGEVAARHKIKEWQVETG